jgi:hypothetical protein
MNKIIMKITGYDELSNSLIVSYASDTTKSQDPSDYTSYAYQPMTMWPDVTDLNEIKKRMAQAGIATVHQQKIKEDFVADPAKIDAYKNMVGQTIEFNVSDLVTPTEIFTLDEVTL